MLKWLKRNVDSRAVEDCHKIANIEYNSMAGAQKNIEVGPALEYVGVLTAATKVQKGEQLYIHNTGALAYVTMGEDDSVALVGAPGADSFPIEANSTTVYSAADYEYIIGTAAMHLYRLRDGSRVRSNESDR